MKAGVVVTGASKLRAKIASYSASLLAPMEMWAQITRELATAEHIWFEGQGSGSWEPLSAEYAGQKAAEFPGKPILQATGGLLEAMINPALAAKITSPDSLQWVSTYSTPDGRYNLAELHRDGTPKMPSRNPVVSREKLSVIALAAARVQARWP